MRGGGAGDKGLTVKVGVYGPHRLQPGATSTGIHGQMSSPSCLYIRACTGALIF